MRLRYPLLAAFCLALPALAGCGGGGGGESTESTAKTVAAPQEISKADLISQGDAICAEVNAAVGTVGANSSESSSEVGQVADIYTGLVDSLKGLGTPEDGTGYPEFIAAAEALAKAEGEAKLAEERGDSVALSEAESRAAEALASFQSEASSYGFEKCSEGPSAPTPTAPAEAEEGGVEAEPEVSEEAEVEEAAPEEVAPETGGAGGGVEEVAPEGGGTGGGVSGGGSGGVGPG